MLKGQRVTLRAIEREDVATIWAINIDIEVELAGGGDPPWPQSLARAYADFERQTGNGGRDGDRDGVFFAISADEKMIGFCGLRGFDPFGRTYELGITIGDRAYWGRGYGREAVGLLVDYAFRMLNVQKVWLRVHGRNERAYRAYRAVGFVEEGRQHRQVWSDGDYDDLVLMGILREAWPPATS